MSPSTAWLQGLCLCTVQQQELSFDVVETETHFLSEDCTEAQALLQHPQHRYVVAQVDYMKDALQGVKVTPTFAVFKKGRKVDQFFGPSPQQLRDRVWLHSDDADDS